MTVGKMRLAAGPISPPPATPDKTCISARLSVSQYDTRVVHMRVNTTYHKTRSKAIVVVLVRELCELVIL